MADEKKIDLTTYPEGMLEVAKLLDFLPDDDQVRLNYLGGMAFNMIRQ